LLSGVVVVIVVMDVAPALCALDVPQACDHDGADRKRRKHPRDVE
jgi:hypothetical protein